MAFPYTRLTRKSLYSLTQKSYLWKEIRVCIRIRESTYVVHFPDTTLMYKLEAALINLRDWVTVLIRFSPLEVLLILF